MSLQSQIQQNIEALGDNSIDVRKQAAISLRKLGPHPEIPVKSLIAALKDKSPIVRREVVKTIGVIGDQSAVNSLIDILDDMDETIVMRKYAAEALGKIGGSKAFQYLARNKAQDEVRAAAIKALSNFGEPAVDVLSKTVKNNQIDGEVRERAIESLGLIGGAAVPVLTSFLEKSNYYLYHAVIAEALGNTRDSRAVPSLIKILKRPCHVDGPDSENWQIAAVKSLMRIGEPEGIEAVKKAAVDKKRYGLVAQEAALESLKKLRARST